MMWLLRLLVVASLCLRGVLADSTGFTNNWAVLVCTVSKPLSYDFSDSLTMP
jgi:glycosylphosphatidylinositol transamidase (GPIT) subunit GPI8